MKVKAEELKPCPFCGSQAGIYAHVYGMDDVKYSAECSMCWCHTDWIYRKEDDAVAAWNRRAGGWKLFTDELPPEEEEVWITYRYVQFYSRSKTKSIDYYTTSAVLYKDKWTGEWEMWDEEGRVYKSEDCIAWMPEPEPYKEEKEGGR